MSMRPSIFYAASIVVALSLPAVVPANAARIAQQSYATPDAAAAALASATRSQDNKALSEVLGPSGNKLIFTGDRYADQERERRFAAAYDEKHTLDRQGPDRVILSVGDNDWPLPIPIVQSSGRWRFDTAAGAQELINRRIGADELNAIRMALSYVNAQKDYFERTKQQSGTGFYAERLISTPGTQDGLYWPAAAGAPESPLAHVVARAEEQGYAGAFSGTRPIPYEGYYFRVLKAQGPDTPEGAKSYINAGKMTDGFAMIAWPSRYGSSGIMTFQVNQDGVVFQKDLGPNTARTAGAVTRFDPDLTWARVEVTTQ